MKQITLFMLALIGFGLSLQAQIKPVAGDISLGFQVKGLGTIAIQEWNKDAFDIPEVMGRYYLTDKIALRARLGIQVLNNTVEFSDSYIDSVRFPAARQIDSATVSTVSSSGFSISPGVEYHVGSDASKLDPYVGLEVLLGFKGRTETEVDQEYRQTVSDGTTVFREDINVKTREDGGIAFGVNLLGGFNYFFSEKIAIGAEYSIGFLNQRIGGDVRVATTGTFTPGGNSQEVIPIDQTVIFQSLTTGTNFVTGATGGVNLSIFW